MRIPLYQVDAFTNRLFGGNPAAVCPLAEWLPDATMQAIAAENNLAETAFFVAQGEGYLLRWFTPTVEVDLCGHATLASGYVVTHILTPDRRSVTFDTLKAGPLEVRRDGDLLAMDFPAWPPEPSSADPRILAALGKMPAQSFVARGRTLAVYERAEDVAALRPDFAAMRAVPGADAIVTAPGEADIDFVSLLRAKPRYRRGSGDGVVALRADALLGGPPRQAAAAGAADLGPRRRFRLHLARRPHHPRRPRRALSRRHDHGLSLRPWYSSSPLLRACEEFAGSWISTVRPSRQPLRGFLRLRKFLNAIN